MASARNLSSGGHKPLTSAGAPGGADWLWRVGVWIVAVTFGALTMASVIVLLVWDALPQAFPSQAHLLLGAVPLTLIVISLLIYQAARRPSRLEIVKAAILAAAFLFWAANQLLPEISEATLFNDLAIALFVLDVFLAIVGWPPESFARALNISGHLPQTEPPSANGTGDVQRALPDHSEILP